MKKRKKAFLLSAVLLGTMALMFHEPVLQSIGDYLIIEDEVKPVDVIHVIAGDDYRSEYAFQLYRLGDAKTIFFTGGWCTTHGWEHGAHGKQLALQQGIPAEAVAFDDTRVYTTYAEALRLKDWLDHHSAPIRSVMVVSDPFHMRRVRWIYRQVFGGKVEIRLAPVPFEQTPYQRQWWSDQGSREYVKDEYVKSIFYVLRYQLAWGSLKEWLSTFDVY
jgi:uncharacterized SAM-binding protein YcdF (DUF218 family)